MWHRRTSSLILLAALASPSQHFFLSLESERPSQYPLPLSLFYRSPIVLYDS